MLVYPAFTSTLLLWGLGCYTICLLFQSIPSCCQSLPCSYLKPLTSLIPFTYIGRVTEKNKYHWKGLELASTWMIGSIDLTTWPFWEFKKSRCRKTNSVKPFLIKHMLVVTHGKQSTWSIIKWLLCMKHHVRPSATHNRNMT